MAKYSPAMSIYEEELGSTNLSIINNCTIDIAGETLVFNDLDINIKIGLFEDIFTTNYTYSNIFPKKVFVNAVGRYAHVVSICNIEDIIYPPKRITLVNIIKLYQHAYIRIR